MFSLRTAFLNVRRRRSKSMLVLLTCMAVVIFVFFYMDSVETNRKQLEAMPQALPVTAQIENLNGSRIVGLEIQSGMVDQIENSGLIKDLRYTTRLAANFPTVPDEANKYKAIAIMGANDLRAVPNLQEDQIKLIPGVSMDFIRGQEAVCVADESFLKENSLSVGDTVDLILYQLKAGVDGFGFSFEPLGNAGMRIVGTMNQIASTDGMVNLLCPAGWAKAETARAGKDFYLDSTSFTVADPLELDKFKAAMKELYLLPVNPLAATYSVKGCALSVKDETFIAAAGRVKSNLTMLYSFAVVIFVVIVLIGYAIAYLLMQSRRADIAIMRSLGAGQKQCVLVMLIEYGVLGFAGCLLGAACAALWTGLAWGTLWLAMLFYASLMLGVAAAVVQISRVNTMTGLVKTES